MSDIKDSGLLQKELVDLFNHIKKMRHEIAAIKMPNDRFENMTDELDVVTQDTAAATNTIMDSIEKINEISFEMTKLHNDQQQQELSKQIQDYVGNIILSCSFQDITGQRISKVVKALRYVEEKVDSLVIMWGKDSIKTTKIEEEKPLNEYQQFLNGPALPGEGHSQSQIDQMIAGQKVTAQEPDYTAAAKVSMPAANSQENPPPPAAASATIQEAATASEVKTPLDQNSIDALFG